MSKFVSFPSIRQYKDAIKQIQQSAKFHEVSIPTLRFYGTVKLHGTNAGIVCDSAGKWHTQSRERAIVPGDDNAGFAGAVYGSAEAWNKVFENLGVSKLSEKQQLCVFGEWCGGNIQKGVGISKLPKMFVVFGVGVATQEQTEGGEEHFNIAWWELTPELRELFTAELRNFQFHFSTDFETFFVDVDCEVPALQQNEFAKLTLAVEEECPVAKQLLPDSEEILIGEGIVWEVDLGGSTYDPLLRNTLRTLRFKTKGEKHSASKVKVVAQVDETKVKGIEEFVEFACTQNRLQQGLDKLAEKGLEPVSENTGEFIRWVIGDIAKEEAGTLEASGLTLKEVSNRIASKARSFYSNL